MRVRYTRTALAELDKIFAYVAERNAGAADKIIDRIDDLVTHLGEFPQMGCATDEEGVRIAPVGRFPYIVFYTIADDAVVVLHVRHGARLRP
jgi:toxin ParE1/3/4